MTSATPEILFLSHCVPNPPNKGEKIRAYHELVHLQRRFRVHLCCFAKDSGEVADAEALRPSCASVFVHQLSPLDKPLALLRFGLGACLDTAYYRSPAMLRRVRELAREGRVSAAVGFSSVMMTYVPDGVPLVFDLVDVDSEKWFQYATLRRPGFPYAMEGRRMRELEVRIGRRARCVLLTTGSECALFQSFAPGASVKAMENGVDFERFSPLPAPAGPPSIAFVGAMDYYPNVDAACHFASDIFPALREAVPGLQFVIVGRNPAAAVRKLSALPGVVVAGTVPDVRPYVAAARFCVTPLRLARGIQNKVLESLAMDKPVLASRAVAKTFGERLPYGVLPCDTPAEYLRALLAPPAFTPGAIRQRAVSRFTWSTNLALLETELDHALVAAESDVTHSSRR